MVKSSSSSNYSGGGNDYMPMSGDIRSNSMIYEEMAAQTQPTNVEEYNAYDYAIGHVWARAMSWRPHQTRVQSRDWNPTPGSKIEVSWKDEMMTCSTITWTFCS